jgi:hypothetical protein
VDLRDALGPARDQGRRGTCVAFAATSGHELVRAEGLDLSDEFLYWAAKTRDGRPDEEGTTLAAASEALADLGQPLAVTWPYDETRDSKGPGYTPPPGAEESALERRLVSAGGLALNAPAIRNAVDGGAVVVLGLLLHQEWYVPLAEGRIAMPPDGAVAIGAHAVLIAGYIDGEGDGGGRFWVRNSWGSDWGDDGYGLLPYAYVDKFSVGALRLGADA